MGQKHPAEMDWEQVHHACPASMRGRMQKVVKVRIRDHTTWQGSVGSNDRESSFSELCKKQLSILP